MNDGKKVLSGFVANGYGQVVTLLSQIALIPIFTSAWGVKLYGEWLLLIALPMYISMSDLGFSNTAANELCMNKSTVCEADLNTLFASSFYLTVALGALLSGALILLFPILSRSGVYKFEEIQAQLLLPVFSLYVLYMFLVVLCGSIAPIYKYMQQYALNIYINNTIRLFEGISIAVVLIFHQGIVALVEGIIIVRAIGLGVLVFFACNAVPYLSFSPRCFSVKKVKEIINPSLSFSIFSVGVNLLPQVFITAIGRIFGPESVVLYSLSKTIARFGFQMINAYSNSLSVQISHLCGSQNWRVMFLLVDRSVFYAVIFSIIFVLTGMVSIDHILSAWVRHSLSISPVTFALISGASLLQAIWITLYMVFAATNSHGQASKIYVLLNVIFIGVLVFIPLPKNIDLYLLVALINEAIMLLVLLSHYISFKRSKVLVPHGALWRS